MKKCFIIWLAIIFGNLYSIASDVKITLTGSIKEPIVMTIDSRTETIYQLPYEFYIDNKLLPKTAKFSSSSYVYYDITFNKKEEDGRYYVVKINESLMAIKPIAPITHNEESPQISGLDLSIDVNNVPNTKKQSPNTFALIIANENYNDNKNKVEMAINDGFVFKEYCVKTLGIPENNIKYFTDATYGQFIKALRNVGDIAKAYNGNINLIIYYAGHGIPEVTTGDAFLMPIDADGTDLDVCFSLKRLYDTIDLMGVNQTVIFLDACFSGVKRDGGMIVAARGVAIKPTAAEPKGTTIVFTATSGEEPAYSYKDKKHGMFSYFLLKKLKETKGEVKLGDLIETVSKDVRQNSIVINGCSQTPHVTIPSTFSNNWKSLRLSR